MTPAELGVDPCQLILSGVATASASVPPFIGPITLRIGQEDAYWHAGDGGLYENSGIESLVLLYLKQLQVKRAKRALIIALDSSYPFWVGEQRRLQRSLPFSLLTFDFSRVPSIMEEQATAYQALFFRSLQMERLCPDPSTLGILGLRHADEGVGGCADPRDRHGLDVLRPLGSVAAPGAARALDARHVRAGAAGGVRHREDGAPRRRRQGGLLVLAVSAGAPLLPCKLGAFGADAYVFSLVVTSSLLAIVLVPAWVAFLADHFGVAAEISPWDVATVAGKAFLFSLAIGVAIRAMLPTLGQGIADRLLAMEPCQERRSVAAWRIDGRCACPTSARWPC
jgi:hypothetical protein